MITKTNITELTGHADAQLSTAEASLRALNDQLDVLKRTYDGEMQRLDGIIERAQEQIDVLRGIDTGVSSVAAALAALAAAIAAAGALQRTETPAQQQLRDDYASAFGRYSIGDVIQYGGGTLTRSAGGFDYSSPGGLSGTLRSTDSLAAIAAANPWIAAVWQQQYGVLPRFEAGSDYVPFTAPALVHQGERIVPAAYNRSDVTNEALLGELRLVRLAIEDGVKYDKRTADTLVRVTRDGESMLTEAA